MIHLRIIQSDEKMKKNSFREEKEESHCAYGCVPVCDHLRPAVYYSLFHRTRFFPMIYTMNIGLDLRGRSVCGADKRLRSEYICICISLVLVSFSFSFFLSLPLFSVFFSQSEWSFKSPDLLLLPLSSYLIPLRSVTYPHRHYPSPSSSPSGSCQASQQQRRSRSASSVLDEIDPSLFHCDSISYSR